MALLEYVTPGALPFEEIRRIYTTAREVFPGFIEIDSADIHQLSLTRMRLPAIEELKRIDLLDITVGGQLDTQSVSRDLIANMLNTGAKRLGQIGSFHFDCLFQEMMSKQTRRCPDSVGIWYKKGVQYFSYSARGSNVFKDVRYRKEFLTHVARVLNLPLTVQGHGGHFVLKASANCDLWISDSFGDEERDPTGFLCEIPPAGSEELEALLDLFLQEFAKKRFEYIWGASDVPCEAGKEVSRCYDIYQLVVESRLPAKRYSLDADFQIKTIEQMESLHGFCGPKDEMFITLCSFSLANENDVVLSVIVSEAGHALHLALRYNDSGQLAELCGKLKVTVVAR
jgi:hypothetical protein